MKVDKVTSNKDQDTLARGVRALLDAGSLLYPPFASWYLLLDTYPLVLGTWLRSERISLPTPHRAFDVDEFHVHAIAGNAEMSLDELAERFA